jgi:hypothetical protein
MADAYNNNSFIDDIEEHSVLSDAKSVDELTVGQAELFDLFAWPWTGRRQVPLDGGQDSRALIRT